MTSPRTLSKTQSLVLFSLLIATGFCISYRVSAQSNARAMGLSTDWSHRHVFFSRPGDMATLLRIRRDPRLLHQMLTHASFGLNPANGLNFHGPDEDIRGLDAKKTDPEHEVDWSVSLGGTNSVLPRSKFPALYSAGAPSCANDFIVFPTNEFGSSTQATIVAYDNLYSAQGAGATPGFCPGTTGPSVRWAYNTGSVIPTSPSLSLDGAKVAFVSKIPGTVHVLTPGTTGNNGASVIVPATPGVGNNAVDAKVALSGGHRVSLSSLFVDYGSDSGYVGDDGGLLHKITGVFNGTPTEVTTGGWPVHVAPGTVLNDPVFALFSGNIFIPDSAGHLSYVRDVGSTIGTCASGGPPCLGFPTLAVSSGSALADGVLIDDSTGRVFTETSANGANAQIVQTDSALGSVVRADVGHADAANPLHDGYFDSNYLNNADPSTGFYYVCGKANNASLHPTLYRIGFNSLGVMNSTPNATTLQLARAAAQCSPITIFLNTTTGIQWLFVSVSTRCGASVLVGGGCIMSFNTSSGIPAAASAFVGERNGTSGIIVDNASSVPQASSVYFTNEGTGPCGDGIATGGCAVKLTQSGLK